MTRVGPGVVWYNSGLSDLYHCARLLREAADGRIRVMASHTDPAAPILRAADIAFTEPPHGTGSADYVQWALDVCRAGGVGLFIPSRQVEAVAEAREAFSDQGVYVHAPSPQVQTTLAHKDLLYRDVEGQGLALPEYRVVRSLAQFDEAYSELRERHHRLCVKPTVGIFGGGFRILDEDIDDYDALLRTECVHVSVRAYRDALRYARRPFELMGMQYLEGAERSVDCLAVRGRLAAAVSRRKEGRRQVLESAGPVIDAARWLVARYGLDGIVNVQFKDAGGVAHLLEINPRAAGGLVYSCASGVNFPYWSAAIALGLAGEEEIPVAWADLVVLPVSGAIAVDGVGMS